MAYVKLTGGTAPADGADPRTFPAIYNPLVEAVEQLELYGGNFHQAYGIESGATPPEDTTFLWIDTEDEGGVYALIDHNHDADYLGSDLVEVTSLSPTAGIVNLDFTGTGYRTQILTGDVTYTTSNLVPGKTTTVKLKAGASPRQLAFPAQWAFISEIPTELPADQTGVLTITSFGTTDDDCVAAWAATEPAA